MARKARYLRALPVYVEPEVRERIDRMAEQEELSLAQVIREIIEIGLPVREGTK